MVYLPPGDRVRPPANIGYLTNQLLGILPTNCWVSYQHICLHEFQLVLYGINVGKYNHFQDLAFLKLTANTPENRPFAPRGKDHLPTIHFQGRAVSFREGITVRYKKKGNLFV